MIDDDRVAYWTYWVMASLAAALVGGIILPRLLDRDPFSLRRDPL